MFYYVAHLWALHVLTLLAAVLAGYRRPRSTSARASAASRSASASPLPAVVLFALATAALLSPACAWYDRLRASRRHAWTRYL
jgi:hypothetical protein